jgi:hypothetical protein
LKYDNFNLYYFRRLSMKKIICLLALTVFALSACTMASAPIQGMLFSDIKGPVDMKPGSTSGRLVEGKATATGVIGIVTGDCSYDAALRDALSRAPGSDHLTNIVVDHHSRGILGIWAEYTTIVRGYAAK